MGSNTFGKSFCMTTWGESHGKAIGVVIDGCPSLIPISEEEINQALSLRSPGKSPYTSPRKESDSAQILSGVFEGKTTGAPISILIENHDADSSKYDPIKDVLRPGHANFTYLEKYGVFDWRGGGRASARETAARVAAGAVAQKVLDIYGIKIWAYIKEIGGIEARIDPATLDPSLYETPLFCPDVLNSQKMMYAIEQVKEEGDSLGGVVEFYCENLSPGLGDPVYDKLEAWLAFAMMSIPASKAFEIGEGMQASKMKGSLHNDRFIQKDGEIKIKTNHAGGIVGGISTGMPLIGRVAFKPTSSISKTQESVDLNGLPTEFKLPKGSRHDPCVAIRAVPVVKAMTSLVLADACLSSLRKDLQELV